MASASKRCELLDTMSAARCIVDFCAATSGAVHLIRLLTCDVCDLQITNRLEGRYNTAAVAEAAGWLCTEGHAYQPDGVRYKSTDC